jgi:hypothetical protein
MSGGPKDNPASYEKVGGTDASLCGMVVLMNGHGV